MAAPERHRLNGDIQAANVRLIDSEGGQVGVVSIEEARRLAEEDGLDLVEIVPKGDPPVCRVMDYGKYLFTQSKKRQAARRRQRQFQVKEIKFRPTTKDGDYQVKLRNVRRFLGHGDKVKITVRFRGREMVHPELGSQMLARVIDDLREQGVVEQPARMEGRLMIMIMAPSGN